MDAERLKQAAETARAELLRQRLPAGWWEGELSASALSTATALMALRGLLSLPTCERISATHESLEGARLWKQ